MNGEAKRTRLDQRRAPIHEALENFRRMRVVPFDVPGHKRGRGNPELTATGQLGSVPAVSVAAYCSGVLQREYEAVFVGGKWRVPKSPKRRMPETRPARGRRRRKWCKEYATAELMFREGFPDHLNRSYPLSADSLRRCNRKCRIYMQ